MSTKIMHAILNFLTFLMIQHVLQQGPEITVLSTHINGLAGN